MKRFKNICLLTILIGMVLLLPACGQRNVEGSLEEIMTKVYADLSEDEKPMMLTNTVVTDETKEYYLGTADIEFEEALASESTVGSIAHSVVLVRTKDNADVEAIKNSIKENINPRKWLCVGVEEENVVVKSKGNLIILIMTDSGREKLETAFDNL